MRTIIRRAGAKCSADKPLPEFGPVYKRVFRLHALTIGSAVPHRAHEFDDMRAIGLVLLEGWISA